MKNGGSLAQYRPKRFTTQCQEAGWAYPFVSLLWILTSLKWWCLSNHVAPPFFVAHNEDTHKNTVHCKTAGDLHISVTSFNSSMSHEMGSSSTLMLCRCNHSVNILTAYFVLQLVLTDTTCHIKYLLLCRSSKSGIHYLQGLSFFLEGEGKASLLAGRSVVFSTSTNTPKIKHWVNLKLLQLLQVTQQPQVAGKPITGSHLKPV